MSQLDRFFDELQTMSFDKKVEFAADLADQIIPKMNEIYGHEATEYEVFWFFGGLASIPEIFNDYGLTDSTYKLFIKALQSTKQNNLKYDSDDDDFGYDSFRKNIYSQTRDLGSSYHVDSIFKQLDDEYKVKACFFMAVMASSDGAMTNDERQLVSYFFANGTWNTDTDIWANEIKAPKVYNPPETSNSNGDTHSTPTFKFTANNEYVNTDEGSYLIGVILVLFLNWIGLIVAIVMRKRKTTKAAIITFAISIVLSIALYAILIATGLYSKLISQGLEEFNQILMI